MFDPCRFLGFLFPCPEINDPTGIELNSAKLTLKELSFALFSEGQIFPLLVPGCGSSIIELFSEGFGMGISSVLVSGCGSAVTETWV